MDVLKISRSNLDKLTQSEAEYLALSESAVITYIGDKKIHNMKYELYPGCEARLHIYLERNQKEKKIAKQ